jgi:hypothetical protein
LHKERQIKILDFIQRCETKFIRFIYIVNAHQLNNTATIYHYSEYRIINFIEQLCDFEY